MDYDGWMGFCSDLAWDAGTVDGSAAKRIRLDSVCSIIG